MDIEDITYINTGDGINHPINAVTVDNKSIVSISTATLTSDGLATAYDVKTYVDSNTIQVINMTETNVTISSNKFYIWGEVTELDLTLETPTNTSIYNEYMIQFTSGSTPTTLILPSSITWFAGNNVISANKTYQISIVNNLAVLGEF